MLKNNYNNNSDLKKVLWNQKCDGEIVVNKDVFEIIASLTAEDQKKYLEVVRNYIVSEIIEPNAMFKSMFSIQAEVLGKIAYYCSKIAKNSGLYYSFFSALWANNAGLRFEQEFKKNNYYEFKDCEQIWIETKNSGTAYPGME